MAAGVGRNQKAALRQIVANGGSNLRRIISQAQRNSRATGNSVVRELNSLSARGNSSAKTVLSLMKRGGASTGGNGG